MDDGADVRTRASADPGARRYVYLLALIGAMGGLLWGYDTGVTAGALGSLTRTFHLGSFTKELSVSAVLIGTIIGAILGGRFADWLGRKRALVAIGCLFVVSSVLTAIAPTLATFIVFRILQGMAVGSASVVSPMYISEVAPPAVRGRLGFFFQFMITVGILVSYLVDYAVIQLGGSWRPMFLAGVVPSAVLAVGMVFLSETPRWYGKQERWDDARGVLQRVNPADADAEVEAIRGSLEEARQSRPSELFRGGLRWALGLGVGLSILQQFVGIDAITYYAPTVTGYSGVANGPNGSLIGAILVGAVFVFGEVIAVAVAERFGRRPLLLVSNGVMFLTMTAIGVVFLFNYHHLGVLLLVLILVYVLGFAIGMGPIFWLFSAEIFPTRLRGYGSSMSATGNWSADLVVSITFLTLVGSIGLSGTFWIYAFFALVSIGFVLWLAPETKQRPLEEIEAYWERGRRWPRRRRRGELSGRRGERRPRRRQPARP